MKQATVKTLGAAALGAAIAATGAGTASAASLDGVQKTADDLVSTLPVEETASNLPAKSLTGESASIPLAGQPLSHTAQGGALTDPTKLLGGLPLGQQLTGGGLGI